MEKGLIVISVFTIFLLLGFVADILYSNVQIKTYAELDQFIKDGEYLKAESLASSFTSIIEKHDAKRKIQMARLEAEFEQVKKSILCNDIQEAELALLDIMWIPLSSGEDDRRMMKIIENKKEDYGKWIQRNMKTYSVNI